MWPRRAHKTINALVLVLTFSRVFRGARQKRVFHASCLKKGCEQFKLQVLGFLWPKRERYRWPSGLGSGWRRWMRTPRCRETYAIASQHRLFTIPWGGPLPPSPFVPLGFRRLGKTILSQLVHALRFPPPPLVVDSFFFPVSG